ncbi:MAG TPA: hypothetical protein VGV59_06105 [Pyrinomonadaceae bacterium]|nr:hypothetical protein [Pyrinomonadaceae bacterium]
MRLLKLFLLVVLSAGSSVAVQTSTSVTDAPGVAVIKSSWRRVVRNPALDEDPTYANREQMALERARRETMRTNEVRQDLGLERLPIPSRSGITKLPSDAPSAEYLYEVKLSNTGQKTIRMLVWNFIVIEQASGREVGQHKFTTLVGLRPGKSKSLTARSTSPPASIVDAASAGKQVREQYSERIVIERIEYDDNTVWERASN